MKTKIDFTFIGFFALGIALIALIALGVYISMIQLGLV